jgi:hypothetical protein
VQLPLLLHCQGPALTVVLLRVPPREDLLPMALLTRTLAAGVVEARVARKRASAGEVRVMAGRGGA